MNVWAMANQISPQRAAKVALDDGTINVLFMRHSNPAAKYNFSSSIISIVVSYCHMRLGGGTNVYRLVLCARISTHLSLLQIVNLSWPSETPLWLLCWRLSSRLAMKGW